MGPILIYTNVWAEEGDARQGTPFEFRVGDNLMIQADKTYRRTSENYFEATGNVVITHYSEALYGEAASMDLNTGDINIKGSVRYIGPIYTIYGSELFYNTKSKFLNIRDARIIATDSKGSFTVVGKSISRTGPNMFEADDAEYTTCRDCPESWSVYGKKVYITQREYVRVHNALLKVNGITVMYLPYVFFPIKKGRQTGLLFPRFSISFTNGIGYRQPFFWAINDHSDLTLIPSTLAKRGFSNESRLRHEFGWDAFVEVNNLSAWDKRYDPGTPKNEEFRKDSVFRHFTEYEHQFSLGNWFHHHAYYNYARDGDIVRNYDGFTGPKLEGSDLGGSSFFDFRSSFFDFNIEGFWKRNNLVADPYKFDNSYVQILPSLGLSLVPINLVHSSIPGLQNINLGIDLNYNRYRQVKRNEGNYIRNADRFGILPYVDWNLLSIGPANIKTFLEWDHHLYEFPQVSGEKRLKKTGQVITTTASIEIDRVFGLAYKENIPIEEIDLVDYQQRLEENRKKTTKSDNEKEHDELQKQVAGDVPQFESSLAGPTLLREKVTYKHGQEFNLVHHYIVNEKVSGNQAFAEQINFDEGWFDENDNVRSSRHIRGNVETNTGISEKNTIEFQWNNNLIKKTASRENLFEPYKSLREVFSYTEIGFFKMSQGYEFSNLPGQEKSASNFVDNLTRLYTTAGYTLEKTTLTASDYYFWQNGNHIFSIGFNQSYNWMSYSLNVSYDSISVPVAKSANGSFATSLFRGFPMKISFDYNMAIKELSRTDYNVAYRPSNNCWMIDFSYTETPIERVVGFNFYVNFSENKFIPITGR